MLVAVQFVTVATTPLNVTVLVPWVAPKLVPAIVIPLLACPPTVTTTGPVIAPTGTGAEMLVALHVLGVVKVPLKVTVLVPCVEPKLVPAIVTAAPMPPTVGVREVIVGAGGGT